MPLNCEIPNCINVYYNNGYCTKHLEDKTLCASRGCKRKATKNFRCKIHQDWKPICLAKSCMRYVMRGSKLCEKHGNDKAFLNGVVCRYTDCERIRVKQGYFCKYHTRSPCKVENCGQLVKLKFKKITLYCPDHLDLDNHMLCYVGGCTNLKRARGRSFCAKHTNNIKACVHNNCRNKIYKNCVCKRHFLELYGYEMNVETLMKSNILDKGVEKWIFERRREELEELNNFKADPSILDYVYEEEEIAF